MGFFDEPFVHLCGSRYVDWTEEETEIKVYSNQRKMALYVDGAFVGEQEGDHDFVFKVRISGEHEILFKMAGGAITPDMVVEINRKLAKMRKPE